MAMLDLDPARRPAAADCARLLAGLPSMTLASQRPSPGQASLGQPSVGQASSGQPSSGQPSLGQPYFGQPFPGRPGAGWAELRPASAAGPSSDTAAMTRPVAVGTAGRRPRRRGRVVTAIAGMVALVVAGSLIALRFHGSPQSSGTTAGGTSAPPATPAASWPGTATASAPARPAGATSPSRKTASTAPKLVPVPHVVGMTFTRARLILIGDGFRVVGRHVRPGQTVTSTSPSGKARAGSVITVVYGTGL
jgi:hypothetical protein